MTLPELHVTLETDSYPIEFQTQSFYCPQIIKTHSDFYETDVRYPAHFYVTEMSDNIYYGIKNQVTVLRPISVKITPKDSDTPVYFSGKFGNITQGGFVIFTDLRPLAI